MSFRIDDRRSSAFGEAAFEALFANHVLFFVVPLGNDMGMQQRENLTALVTLHLPSDAGGKA